MIISLALVLAAILSFGADRNDFALLFSGLLALQLGVLLLTQEWARSALVKRFNFLAIPGGLFLLAWLAIAWAATPSVPTALILFGPMSTRFLLLRSTGRSFSLGL